MEGVTNVVPVPSAVPPLEAANQEMLSEEAAVSVTVPGPQFDPAVTVGGPVTLI